MKIKYGKKWGLFKHPESIKEYQDLMRQLSNYYKLKDLSGIIMTAVQLIPDVIEEEK